MRAIYAVVILAFFEGGLLHAQQNQPTPPIGNQSSYPAETHKMSSAEKSETTEAKGGQVDLNSASKKDIAALPGIGPDFAQSIIDARPYHSKEDLLKFKVIPQATYNEIKDRVYAGGPKKQSTPDGNRNPGM